MSNNPQETVRLGEMQVPRWTGHDLQAAAVDADYSTRKD